MKRLLSITTLAFFSGLVAISAQDTKKTKVDPAKLVEEARFSQASQNYTMTGELRRSLRGKRVPFKVKMDGDLKTTRFYFSNPTQIISLVMKDSHYELTEQVAGKPRKALDPKRYGEPVRGTDVTYEDISQRFLYWKGAKLLGDEKLRIQAGARRDAWIIRLDNPRRDYGPYAVVKVWIDKENKALLKVEGFDWEGKKIKRFEVDHVQKDKVAGVWVLEAMRVETIDHKGKRKSVTHMKLGSPQRTK